MIIYPKNLCCMVKNTPWDCISFLLSICLWVLIFHSPLSWLWTQAFNGSYFLTISLLCIAAVAGVVQGTLFLLKNKLFPSPHWNFAGIIIISTCFLMHIYNMASFRINSISAALLILGIIGFAYIYFPLLCVNRSFIPLFTCIAFLPYAAQLNDLFSFPLRIWIAKGLSAVFRAVGIDMVSQHTILSAEYTSADIAAACSGIKSIWAIILCYCLLSWIGKKRFSLTWIAGAVVSVGVVILFNIFRILLLVTLSLLQWNKLESVVHKPFGIFLFAVTIIIVFLLFKKKVIPRFSGNAGTVSSKDAKPSTLVKILLPVSLSAMFLITPQAPVPNADIPDFQFKSHDRYFFEPSVFSDIERSHLATFPIDTWCKARFRADTLCGSLAVIQSSMSRAHHHPFRCLKGAGGDLKELGPLHLNNDFSLNQVYIRNTGQYACFWFQNENLGTSDYSQRLWQWLTEKQKTWTMISIVFDHAIDTKSEMFIKFVTWLYSEVNNLQKERT